MSSRDVYDRFVLFWIIEKFLRVILTFKGCGAFVDKERLVLCCGLMETKRFLHDGSYEYHTFRVSK